MKKITLLVLTTFLMGVADANDFPTDERINQQMKQGQIPNYHSDDWDKAVKKAEQQRQVFKEIEPRPNNFPNVHVQNSHGINIEDFVERYKRKAEKRQSQDGVMAFASLSMPPESLKKLVQDVSKVGGVVVFRGFKDGSYMEMVKAISKLGLKSANVQVNPQAFKTYRVDKIPAIVLIKPKADEKLDLEGCVLPEYHSKVTGDVSLQYALELMKQQETQDFVVIADRYLSLMKGSN